MKKNGLIISLFIFCAAHAQEPDKTIQKGNTLYRQKQYDQAASAYDEVLAKDPSNKTAKFNRANAAYRLAKPDDAIKAFDELSSKTKDAGEKAKSYYNKGVILSSQKKLEESIEAYKNALRQDPSDMEARENLQKALRELKKKTPPPKKEDNKKKQQQNKKQQQQQQPKMNPNEADQKLKLLDQKEKQLQQKAQKQKVKTGGDNNKDW